MELSKNLKAKNKQRIKFSAWYIYGEKEWNYINKKDAIDVLSNCDEPELNDFEDARDIINYVDEHKDDVISL